MLLLIRILLLVIFLGNLVYFAKCFQIVSQSWFLYAGNSHICLLLNRNVDFCYGFLVGLNCYSNKMLLDVYLQRFWW